MNKRVCWLVGLLLSMRAMALSDARRTAIEADWLRQLEVRGGAGAVAAAGGITPAEDAAGGVDGVKDGKWGFHTENQVDPWWQVDLGASQPLGRVVLYNRCDLAERNNRILVLVSDDAKTWRQVYQHNGTTFLGFTDGKPLSVPLTDVAARYVRLALRGQSYFHLDEVEVYGTADPALNLALRRTANQSSVSQWSARHSRPVAVSSFPIDAQVAVGRDLLAELKRLGVDTTALGERLEQAAKAPRDDPRAAYCGVRWAVRALALADPRLGTDKLVFVKRQPGSYSHVSDQNYGWWSRPGGGVYVLDGLRGDEPTLRCLTADFPEGSFQSPELSYDGQRVLFAYCRFHPGLAASRNKVDKDRLPEDSFYHIYEIGLDGTGLRQVTRGRYDDFTPRWLPSGDIVFLSTRRGQLMTCGKAGEATLTSLLPDSYVRCGGDHYRPVAVYTLHTMHADGSGIRTISAFESFEWDPVVADDGRIVYARWDYVDRTNNPFFSLWSCNPDGTNPQAVFKNYTRDPQCSFEARPVPGSPKFLFTGAAHHSITAGSLALLDPARGLDGPEPMTRLTPEVCFPEWEGWPRSWYCNPYPLGESAWLCAWSDQPLRSEGGQNNAAALGLYLGHAGGNLELLYRDPTIGCQFPLPVRARPVPPVLSSAVDWEQPEGRFLIGDIYQGLPNVERGSVKRLRIVAMPLKVQPEINQPVLGVTGEDPSKCVLGTVPVEADGSVNFRVPAGLPVFFQALDADGLAVQTMRSLTYVQPHQTLSCIGCHEPRNTAPPNRPLAAASRAPSRLTPPVAGAWPLRFDKLVQPVLDARCVSCHAPGRDGAKWDLTPARAYATLMGYGSPNLTTYVKARWSEGRSLSGQGPALSTPLWKLLTAAGGHRQVVLGSEERERLATWMDTYAQRLGSFSVAQEAELEGLKVRWAGLLAPR